MDQGSVEELSKGQKLSRSIHLAIESCRDCDKKQLKSSTDKPGIEWCQGSIEVALKQFFKKGKTQKYFFVKHATQPMIQTTF